MVIEIDYKHLVLRIAGARKCHRCGDYVGAFRAHASAVINKNANRDRDIFMTEVLDLLQYAVFMNLEIVFVEPGDESIMPVKNCRAQNDHVGIQLEGVLAAIIARRWLGNLCEGNKWRNKQSNEAMAHQNVVL